MKYILLTLLHLFIISYVIFLGLVWEKRTKMLIYSVIIGPLLLYLFMFQFLLPMSIKYNLPWIEFCLHLFFALTVYSFMVGIIRAFRRKKLK